MKIFLISFHEAVFALKMSRVCVHFVNSSSTSASFSAAIDQSAATENLDVLFRVSRPLAEATAAALAVSEGVYSIW